MKRTLLHDLEKIYYSLKCENEDNTVCTYCEYCKNKVLCNLTANLLKSLKKIY